MTCHKDGYCGHQRKSLWGWGDNINTWRINGTWIYATHFNPYISVVNFGLPNNWVCYNGYIYCIGCCSVPALGWWNTVHQHRWIWVLWTIMVIFHQSISFRSCHLWINYRFIPYCTIFHLDQILSHHNYTLVMGKVGYLVGLEELIVDCLGGSFIKVDLSGVEKINRVT